jgi:DnaJ-class molecular chaperone
MKKKLIIATIALVTAAAAYAESRCQFCGGSGWAKGSNTTRCIHCGGDGVMGN